LVINILVFQEDIKEEIQLVSAIPVSPPEEWDYDTAHEYEYLINENTFIQIFAQAYSVAFCLDISPSMSAVVKPLVGYFSLVLMHFSWLLYFFSSPELMNLSKDIGWVKYKL